MPAAVGAGSLPAGPTPAATSPASVSRRRALSRDQPVTETTSSRIWPRTFFPALTYVLAYRVVTSARDLIDSPPSMSQGGTQQPPRFAGILS